MTLLQNLLQRLSGNNRDIIFFMVTIDDFSKLEFKVGKVMSADPIEGSEKLLKLMVDVGEDQPRQILSGIAKWYTADDLVNNSFIFITNLAPRMMMGLESQGMLLAAESDDQPVPLVPLTEVAPGAKIR